MTTNAQAALAAAVHFGKGRDLTPHQTLSDADRFKTWLDKHESAELPMRSLTQAEIDAYNDYCAAVPVDERPVNPHLAPEYVEALRAAYPEATDAKLGNACYERHTVAPGVHQAVPHTHESEPEQGDRETQLDALVIPAETTGPDELHADKRPDSYGNRGESRTGRKRRRDGIAGGARGRAESIADQAVELAGDIPGNIVVNMSKGSSVIGFTPNIAAQGGPSPAMFAQIARSVNADRARLM
ncbi:hypothetical protein SEA_ABBA_50 [Arthrobacter phage Abba]|uniref:Uncharacterized protein n=1 Tax=Arthrobacter phage Abba TaxID=2713256 RepID=A0A6G8R2F3_9CAUD|nr:hypothetical protein HYQ28_gp50 [Arthrobacter phage Abba]QIN94379.1 hypothetical protein SEA_ABBA_50 [Arthrobacter phage Abba]